MANVLVTQPISELTAACGVAELNQGGVGLTQFQTLVAIRGGREKLQGVPARKGIEQRGGLSGVQRGEIIEKLHGVRARNPSDSREAGLGLRLEIGEQQCGDVCSKVSHSVSKPTETDHWKFAREIARDAVMGPSRS